MSRSGKRSGKEEENDPRIPQLKQLIASRQSADDKEEAVRKKLWLPLKRVNSNPLIYDRLPLSKNLFPESKSVDYGFNGASMDIPNQVFYKEKLPKDILGIGKRRKSKKSAGTGPSLTASLSFIKSSEIDCLDLDALKKVKQQKSVDFLKNRVGCKNMENLLKNLGNPLSDLPELEKRLEMRQTGVDIPFLNDLLKFNSTNATLEIGNDTSEENTPVGLAEYLAVGGDISDWLASNAASVHFMTITIDVTKLNGKEVDGSLDPDKFKYPNGREEKSAIDDTVKKAFGYLGYELETVTTYSITPRFPSTWTIRSGVFARAKYNLGIMLWYGYKIEEYKNPNSDFMQSLRRYLKIVFLDQTNTEMDFVRTYLSKGAFGIDAKKYLNKISVKRPPDHIPNDWGSCTGSPLCP